MIITTTHSIEGKKITQYLGVITGEAILGANIFRDMFAAVRDIVGGRSASYERELGKAREIALDELEEWAEELGAKAVIGVDLDYESFGQTNGMMMVSATGTAVVIEDAAHALPSSYRGQKVGAISELTCFSFYATKNLTTGEGGMICTEHEAWADRCRVMAMHGISKDAWKRYTAEGDW